MQYLNNKFGKNLMIVVLSFLMIFTMVNCSDDNSITSDTDLVSSQESAEAIASNISTETGGSSDQLVYLSDLADENGIENIINSSSNLAKSNSENIVSVDTSYNSSEGKWTITITRERTVAQRNLTSNFYHVFTVQYLKDGVAQKYFVSNGDTANTIRFNIVEGSGALQSNRLSHNLKSVSGNWTATVENNILAVNGSYNRAAEDAYIGVSTQRNFDFSLQLNFTGISIPTYNGEDLSVYVAGTMSGQFTANYSAVKNGETIEKNVDTSFKIKFTASKTFQIEVDGDEYDADIETGEIEE